MARKIFHLNDENAFDECAIFKLFALRVEGKNEKKNVNIVLRNKENM